MLLLLLLMIASFGSSAQILNNTCGVCGSVFRAGIGDSISSIAGRCGIQVSEIQGANPNLPQNLTGRAIKIPCSGSAGCGVCGESYTVQNGDTLSAIASSCGMDLGTLESSNRDIDTENIFVGQLIRVPCGSSPPIDLSGCGSCGIQYSVTGNGESLTKISDRCQVSAPEILQANPGVNSTSFMQGQKLKIPCGSRNRSCGLCGDSFTVDVFSNRESVAAKCRVGFIPLTSSNPGISSWEPLKLGQILKIPCEKRTGSCSSACNSTFIVQKQNSTVPDIATECNTSARIITYANNLQENSILSQGQRLSLPCNLEAPDPTIRSCSICGASVSPSVTVDLITIAKSCGVTSSGIQRASNTSLENVGFGDVLRVPCDDEAARCGPCGIAYRALDGEGVPEIAVKCSVMIPEVEDANPELDFGEEIAGKIVKIPCFSSGSIHSSSEPRVLMLMLLALLCTFLKKAFYL